LDASTQESESIARRRTNYLWIETSVILLVYLVPLIFTSEADMYGLTGKRPPLPFLYHALHFIITDIGQIALVLFIIWRSGDPPIRFGLKPFRIGRDLFGGILICAILRIAYHATWWSLRTFMSRERYFAIAHSGSGIGYNPPSGAPEFALLAVMCLFSGLVQELVMRAYLITRLEELLESTPMALLFSTMFFTFFHGYQGTAGVIGVAVMGLIEGVIFCLFRRLAPIALAHGFNNFIAIGNLPWL
jgi:membrane protease YdiL (CAAX protease family)